MCGRKRGGVPAPLLRLEQRFAAWRKTRRHGDRIPKTLWKSAARLVAKYGLNQTAKVLKLDYYSLKEHVEREAVDSASAAFVELPSPISSASECIMEFEDGTGACMHVHLRGADVPDVLALADRFWNVE